MDKKGQTSGMVTGLVFGLVGLVIAVILVFVIVSTLTGADLLRETQTLTTVINETQTMDTTPGTIVAAAATYGTHDFTVLRIVNQTGAFLIPTGNYTVNSVTGAITNIGTDVVYPGVNVTYTYYKPTVFERTVNDMSFNVTGGVNNISNKIPTVLLIAAIVLIIGILALLIGVWQKMRMGGNL